MYLNPTDEAWHLANIIPPERKKHLSRTVEGLKTQIQEYEFEAMMIRKYHGCGF